MAEEILNIDHCVDAASIYAKIEELRNLTTYASDFSQRVDSIIKVLEERLLELGEEVD